MEQIVLRLTLKVKTTLTSNYDYSIDYFILALVQSQIGKLGLEPLIIGSISEALLLIIIIFINPPLLSILILEVYPCFESERTTQQACWTT